MNTENRIRRIFLDPQPSYAISEASGLLEYSAEEILTAIEEGDLAVNTDRELARVPWEEVAVAAAEKWPQHIIEAALGEHIAAAMPELARLTELVVRVPRFSVVALDQAAQREGATVDHIVSRHLVDLAATESEALDRSVNGFSAALRWPVP